MAAGKMVVRHSAVEVEQDGLRLGLDDRHVGRGHSKGLHGLHGFPEGQNLDRNLCVMCLGQDQRTFVARQLPQVGKDPRRRVLHVARCLVVGRTGAPDTYEHGRSPRWVVLRAAGAWGAGPQQIAWQASATAFG
jgi:hypothetical protein